MAVPVGGNFSMFGATGTTVAGAIIEGGAGASAVNAVNNFNDLKGLANINKFDPLYSNGAVTLGGIAETVQFRGYPILECNMPTAISGGTAYPNSQTVLLNTVIGNVELTFNAIDIPDRFIVYYNSAVAIDTGYRGDLAYDFGGGDRSLFTNSLVGKIDPISLNAYPDFVTYPSEDGFPPVTSPGTGTASFLKSTASPGSVQVNVYGPMPGTAYSYTVGCPVEITVGIDFINSVIKDDPGLAVESVLLVTRPSNTVINNTTTTTFTGSTTTGINTLHTINVSAIGVGGIISTGAIITLSITGGANPPGSPFVVTDTSGFLTTTYTFLDDVGGYQIDAEVNVGVIP